MYTNVLFQTKFEFIDLFITNLCKKKKTSLKHLKKKTIFITEQETSNIKKYIKIKYNCLILALNMI